MSAQHNIEKATSKRKKIHEKIIEGIITDFLTEGHLTEEDLNLPEEDFTLKMLSISENSTFNIVIDHRERILIEANNLFRKKEFELSKIFYAMFFEHSLNGLIERYCSKKRFDEKTQIDIIRSIDLQGKITWLLKILEFPKFNEAHKKIIKKLSEDRNSFIHYKWKPIPEEFKSNKANEIIEEFKSIKKTITYMKQYESRVIFKRKKLVIAKKIKEKK